jgi:hypothetical protein
VVRGRRLRRLRQHRGLGGRRSITPSPSPAAYPRSRRTSSSGSRCLRCSPRIGSAR